MKATILSTVKNLLPSTPLPTYAQINFDTFRQFIKKKSENSSSIKKDYFHFLTQQLTSRTEKPAAVNLKTACKYMPILEMIYSTLTSPFEEENELFWGLSAPLSPVLFYGTDRLINLLQDEDDQYILDESQVYLDNHNNDYQLEIIYSFILEKLYGITFPKGKPMIHTIKDKSSGTTRYFKLKMDNRFVEIKATKELPEIQSPYIKKLVKTKGCTSQLLSILPLNIFKIRGFTVLTLEDVTVNYSIKILKSIIINKDNFISPQPYLNIINSLKNLVGNSEIEFGLLPVLQINNHFVFNDDLFIKGVFMKLDKAGKIKEEVYLSIAKSLTEDPNSHIFTPITAEATNKHFYLKKLKNAGIQSYALIPLMFNETLAGVLEAYSFNRDAIKQNDFTKIEPVIPYLSQIVQNAVETFNDSINAIIREKFTAIQLAVQWKFNEVAFNYLLNKINKTETPIETITFKDMYPLYGAIDIRNSTIERNKALQIDLSSQLNDLQKTIRKIQKDVSLELLEELYYKSTQWADRIGDQIEGEEALQIDDFISNVANPLLQRLKFTHPLTSNSIDAYLFNSDVNGPAHQHRKLLEQSMQTINIAVNQYLDLFSNELQQIYPCYFEKFRTDGVDYDIYIGQSLTPDKPFDLLYVKNLRLWQLKSMTAVAKLTHSLLPLLPIQLQTTQLIFTHPNTIDISFRYDERRFDVEGAYNIRYQVIKKRIDKVTVKNTDERLTQVGKIAIIYFNQKDADEYIQFIQYLQQENLLEDDIEELELENLQGISGLKALRVSVKL